MNKTGGNVMSKKKRSDDSRIGTGKDILDYNVPQSKSNTELLNEIEKMMTSTPDEMDTDKIEQYLELLQERSPVMEGYNPDNTWERLKEDHPVLFEDEFTATMREPISIKIAKKRRHLRRILVSAAAVVCLAVFTVPPALGYGNIFEMIAHWTSEQFSFSEASENPDNESQTSNITEGEYNNLQEALEQYGIDDAVLPQYIPDGFELQEIWIQEYPREGYTEFSAPYVNGDDNIIITTIQHNGQVDKNYEKHGQAVDQYISGNIEHYIFYNNNNITAAWYVNSLECSISTTLSVTELEKIIDSIYKE